MHVHTLIRHFKANHLIGYNINPNDAASTHYDQVAGTVSKITNCFQAVPEISGLLAPESVDCISIFYNDAFQRLVNVLTCNQVLEPTRFSLDAIQKVALRSSDWTLGVATIPHIEHVYRSTSYSSKSMGKNLLRVPFLGLLQSR